MSTDIDEISVEYEEDGVIVREQLDKNVLTKGAWTTILFKYQDMDKKTGDFKAPKASIIRYRKIKGVYRKQSSFNISSAKQANMICEVLEEWFPAGK
jgi:hypothetical protein